MPVGEKGRFVGTDFRRHLRRQATEAESLLRQRLQGDQLGYKFTWQYKIDGAYVDFCCRTHRVVIEVDGDSHEGKAEVDQDRDEGLRSKGYEVIRFRNEEVLDHIERVLKQIRHVCDARPRWRY